MYDLPGCYLTGTKPSSAARPNLNSTDKLSNAQPHSRLASPCPTIGGARRVLRTKCRRGRRHFSGRHRCFALCLHAMHRNINTGYKFCAGQLGFIIGNKDVYLWCAISWVLFFVVTTSGNNCFYYYQ